MNVLNIQQKEALRKLSEVGKLLTKQEYKTLKGQILSGAPSEAMRGLEKLRNRKR